MEDTEICNILNEVGHPGISIDKRGVRIGRVKRLRGIKERKSRALTKDELQPG